MAWFFLMLALLALVLLHLGWRRRLARSGESSNHRINQLESAHQAELSARDSLQQSMLDSMVEGLLILDETGRIRLASRAFASMFETPSDLGGKTLLEAVRLHDLAELATTLDRDKQIDGCEIKLAGGEDRWVGVSGAALFGPNGAPVGKLLVFHDLTRVKKLERTRQEFVANVSHELRTPLSLITGYAETLLDGAKDNPDLAAKFLHTINRNADRLRLLIEDLLTISELESNRMNLDLQAVDTGKLADKVLGDLASRANNRNIRLINSVPALEVHADAGRLEQVLVNLVDNGIKYGRVGGTVEVAAKPAEAGQIEFTVADNGPGISPEALERLFERFYREDKARSREQGGTGLGLSIVKHIVQCHRGKVWAESTPGHGATFHFTIPQPPQEGTQA